MHRPGVVRPTPPAGKRVSVLGTAPSELVAAHDPDALQFEDRVLHLADGELTEREL